MRRLTDYRFNDAIGVAVAHIPPGIARQVAYADFFCGADPVFAGLHRYADSGSGRPYSQTAHVVYPFHQVGLSLANRRTTVVMPVLEGPWTVAHELGHVLDEVTGFVHVAVPVTAYAQTNRREAFAEAFTAWLGWYGEEFAVRVDDATAALFDGLAVA